MKTKTKYAYQYITPEGKTYIKEFNSHSEAEEFANKKLCGHKTKIHYHKAIVTLI